MTHSRASRFHRLKGSRGLMNSRKLEALDMLEPLREVRDGYLISLNIGTPPQVIQVYMDTGSDLAWVPCGNLSFDCINCDDYRTSNRITSTFSPSRSSSATRDLCTSSFCTDIHSSDNSYDPCAAAGCSLTTLVNGNCPRPCPTFSYTYGSGGLVMGALTRDVIRVHGSTSPNITRQISGFCFGCVGSTYREPIGIAGFGRGSLSLLSQLGLLRKGFSHCFLPFKYANNPNITSPLVIGDLAMASKDSLQLTPLLKSPMYPNSYYIGLKAISVCNSTSSTSIEVSLNLSEFDTDGNGGMLIDSGTTYTHLPKPIYSDLLSKIKSLMIMHPRAHDFENRTGFDLCYSLPCLNNSSSADDDNEPLPSLTFHFLGNVNLTLPKENYFYAMAAPSNLRVVKCFLIQIMDDEDYGPAAVFGSFQQQNVQVVYDLEEERIGFQPMECASSAASQGLHRT
ncbi:hypothetical protein Sjap_003749 [Stephania japonica]|uniref:Peptidase A1 domain-containing protein n=1 Tax=Stephania japonica TaxID=461633 RepID=A0AAP0KRU5_9MAGN